MNKNFDTRKKWPKKKKNGTRNFDHDLVNKSSSGGNISIENTKPISCVLMLLFAVQAGNRPTMKSHLPNALCFCFWAE